MSKFHQILQHSTEGNKFGDEGCINLVEGLKKNKSLKKLNLECASSKTNCFVNHFSGCKITHEGMKVFSSFLSRERTILEALFLGLEREKQS